MTPQLSDERLRAAHEFAAQLEIAPAEVDAHLARFGSRYAESVSSRAMVRHLLMLRTPPMPNQVLSRVTPSETSDDGRRELDVVALDTPGLFSEICGVVSLAGAQAMLAEVHTTNDGIAVDTVELRAPEGTSTSWWARFEGDLVDAVAGRIALRAAVDERAREDGATTDRRVRIDLTHEGRATEVRVRTGDRLGVLFAITDAMAELRLDLTTAHVRTTGDMIDDTFLVCSLDGRPLDDEQARQLEVGIRWAVGRLGA